MEKVLELFFKSRYIYNYGERTFRENYVASDIS